MTSVCLPFPDFLPPPTDPYLALAQRFVAWLFGRRPMLQNHGEDLRQEAALAAVKAARTFDPRRGVAFLTFAWWQMRAAARDYLRRAFDPPRALRSYRRALMAELASGEEVSVPCEAALIVNLLKPVLLEATRPQRHRRYPRALGAAAERDVELFLAVLGGVSLADIAREAGISRERARQVVERLYPAFDHWRLHLR
jgi:RNA polymerase sigma factor (sigma-70 family)